MSAKTMERLKAKHAQLRENRDAMHQLLNDPAKTNNEALCKMNTTELHEAMRNGKVSASDVLYAYLHRCVTLEGQNFLAEYIMDAPQWAKELEDSGADASDSLLHGVPVSLKESIGVVGKDTTIGLVKLCGQPVEEDAVLVKVLRHLKALPFITTSMAQAGLSLNSSNPVFGVQTNPRFEDFVAGGSSGGEGLAISLNASPVGIGSDIGGSIRFPSAFNEICGLKATMRRLSCLGNFKPKGGGVLHLRVALGPMGRNVVDLKNFMSAVLCPLHYSLDPSLVPLPFNVELYAGEKTPGLLIGYYECFNHDSLIRCAPGVKRAVRLAVEVLEKKGHTCVPFTVPRPFEAFCMAYSALFHDSGKGYLAMMHDEPVSPEQKTTLKFIGLPRWLKKITTWVFKRIYGRHAVPALEADVGLASSFEAGKLLAEIRAYQREFLAEMRSVDAIVCPIYPIPIPRVDFEPLYTNAASCYAMLYNLLDLPAGVVPVARTTAEDNQKAQDLVEGFQQSAAHADAVMHQSQTVVGMPLSVQVVAWPFKEELVLRVMRDVEEQCEFHRSMPL